MSFLTRVRPSNLIILTATPFIIYMFWSSAIISDRSGRWQASKTVRASSCPASLRWFWLSVRPFSSCCFRLTGHRARWTLPLAAPAACRKSCRPLPHGTLPIPFIASVVANGVDAFTSTLIVPGVNPRQLTPDADQMVAMLEARLLPLHAFLSLSGLGAMWIARRRQSARPETARSLACRRPEWASSCWCWCSLPHIAFAAGVATTLRAAISAYILAALLGLGWVGMLQLHYSRRTIVAISTLVLLLAVSPAGS